MEMMLVAPADIDGLEGISLIDSDSIGESSNKFNDEVEEEIFGGFFGWFVLVVLGVVMVVCGHLFVTIFFNLILIVNGVYGQQFVRVLGLIH